MRHVFIADGRLHLRDETGAVREIESRFAREKADRSERRKSRDEWKQRDPRDPFSAFLWSGAARGAAFRPWRFHTVMVADEETLFYVLTNGSDMGLFRYDVSTDNEVRLSTANYFIAIGIDYSRADNRFVAALMNEQGNADLELLDSEGKILQTLTGGDSRDQNPSFSRSAPRQLLYQSAGIARDDEGRVLAYGPEAIHRVNLDTRQMAEVLSDSDHDLLLPRDDAAGNLYFIRRPYQRVGARTPLQSLADILTFPFRFVGAVFSFLTTFTRAFGGRGPRMLGPQAQPGPREKHLQVLGQVIDVARLRSARNEDELSLAPGPWELVRRSPDGRIDVLARRISYFDLSPDGTVHGTNGFRVSQLSSGAAEVLFKHRIIESVRMFAAAPPGAAPTSTGA